MGKKKKGGNKLARMSDEERARYLQHRADMEEEARRRKQQLIALYMKNKLKREDAFTRLNLAKINQEWRTILRQLKCDELKKEINNVESFCAETLDRKNQIIRRLLCDLDESEELYSTMLHSHMDNIDRIIKVHSERLRFWREWYVTEKNTMLERFHMHIEGYKIKKNNTQADLECVYFALEEEIRLDEAKTESEYIKRADDFRNTMTIRLEEVTKVRELAMEEMWREFQSVLSSYLAYTKDFHDEYLELKRRDEEDNKIIQSHYCEVARCSDLIVDLRLEYNAMRDDYQFNTRQLKSFKKSLQERYVEVKQILTTGDKIDKKNIRNLVVYSTDALKFLNRILKKGNVLIQLSTICRKLETENEKFLPFGSLTTKKLTHDEDVVSYPPFDFKANTYKNFSKLENFWARYNRARLDCACLQEEKQQLLLENKKLKAKIKDYLVSVTMKTGASSNQDAKLGNRPKSMKIEKMVHIDLAQQRPKTNAERLKQRPVTCIEGNLSVAIRSHKLNEFKYKPKNIYASVNRI